MADFTTQDDDSDNKIALFSVNSWPGPNTISRSWHIKLSDPSMGRREIAHKICLRHGQVTGNYVLIIDGVVQVKGYSPVTERSPFTITFGLEGRDCTIIANGKLSLFSFEHTLIIGGETMPELRTVVDPLLHEKFPTKITAADVSVIGTSAYYNFDVHLESGEVVAIRYRYSQFVMLDQLIRAQSEAHLLSSLPALPPKVYNPYFDQTSKSFLEERKAGLTFYLNALLGNSKARCYTDFLMFLNLNPLTGEPWSNKS